jgi:tetratricopeptide (TPR) repeat protein
MKRSRAPAPVVRAAVTIAAVVMVAAVGTARAGEATGAAPPDAAGAKAAFLEGERQFQLGRFEEAIASYEQAFGLDPQPAFLFNIALAHRRQHEIDGKLEHLLRARELYRNFLRLDPQSPRRPGVEKVLVDLGVKIDEARRQAEPGAEPATPAAALASSPASPRPLPAAALPPQAPPPPALAAAPRSPQVEAAPPPPSKTHWLVIGGIAAAVVGVAVTALVIAARSDGSSFDGPPIDLTPRPP